jgi:hypothetical protein
MNTRLRRLLTAAPLLIGALLVGAATALADPPGRVGRLSDIEGSVALHQPDQPDWTGAGVNYPVTAGDALWTTPESRAEIQVGPAEIRMDEQTEIDVLRLDENGVQIRVDQGTVNLHLMDQPVGGLQIVTAAGQVDLLRPGNYRVDAGQPTPGAPAAPVQIAVFDGQARLVNGRTSTVIAAGQGVVVSADQASLNFVAATMTPFDNWALDRQRLEAASQAEQYVSPEMTGYQDLDRHGQWTTLPDYGAAWIPAEVPPDWAPYRFGHWAYVPPWGWTWIDDAPWGFAPFHYGRWVRWEDRWAWCPGHLVQRPLFAPALVAFIGGPGIDIGRGRGPAVGWVPLAPHEVFHPYYPASQAYVRNINVSHVTSVTQIRNITNVTVNAFANRQAVTVVPNGAFTAAAPVHRAALAVAAAQLGNAPVTRSIDRLQPSPAALHPTAPADLPHARGPAPSAPGGWRQQPVAPGGAPVVVHPPGRPQPQAAPVALPRPPQPQPQPQPQMPHPQALPQVAHPQPQPQPQLPQMQHPQPLPQVAHPQPQPQPPQMQHPQPLPQVAHPQPQPQPQPPQMQHRQALPEIVRHQPPPVQRPAPQPIPAGIAQGAMHPPAPPPHAAPPPAPPPHAAPPPSQPRGGQQDHGDHRHEEHERR